MKLWHEHTHVTISTSGQQTLPALQQLLTYPLPVNTPNWLLLSLLSPQICYSYFDLHVNGITEYVLFRDWLLWLNSFWDVPIYLHCCVVFHGMHVKIHSPDDAKLGYFQVWGFMNILEYALVFRCIILQVYSKFITIRINEVIKAAEQNIKIEKNQLYF